MATIKLSQAYTITVEIETSTDIPGIENIIEKTQFLENFIHIKSEAGIKVYLEENEDLQIESIHIDGIQYSYCRLNQCIEPYDTGRGDDPTEW